MKKTKYSTKRKFKLQSGGIFGLGKYKRAIPNDYNTKAKTNTSLVERAHNGTPIAGLSTEEIQEKKRIHNNLAKRMMDNWGGGKRKSVRKTKSYKKTRKTVKK
jgi:hypothetical protein